MIRILCYGDSNTWGTIPDGTCRRCDITKAYPYFLQKRLGDRYQVICEGMPSRTTDLDDVKFPKGNRNGALFFPQCLISHDPIDYVVLFLGTNDLKSKFNRNANQVADVIEEKYIKFTYNSLAPELTKTPKFIIITPSLIDETKLDEYKGATKKSQSFNSEFQKMAIRTNCLYMSNDNLVCGEDGIHLTTKSHKYIADVLANTIKKNLFTQKNFDNSKTDTMEH